MDYEFPIEKLEIEYKGKKEEIIVREVTWGDQNQCGRDAVIETIMPDGSRRRIIDEIKVRELEIWKSLVKHPFMSINDLKALPKSSGNKISAAYFRMNEVSNSEGSSATQTGMESNTSK